MLRFKTKAEHPGDWPEFGDMDYLFGLPVPGGEVGYNLYLYPDLTDTSSNWYATTDNTTENSHPFHGSLFYIRLTTDEEKKRVQLKAYALGYSWVNGEHKTPLYTSNFPRSKYERKAPIGLCLSWSLTEKKVLMLENYSTKLPIVSIEDFMNGDLITTALVLDNPYKNIHIRINVTSTEESQKVQEYAFKLGYTWGTPKETQVQYLGSKYLFLVKGGNMCYSNHPSTNPQVVELSVTDFLNQELDLGVLNTTTPKEIEITKILALAKCLCDTKAFQLSAGLQKLNQAIVKYEKVYGNIKL